MFLLEIFWNLCRKNYFWNIFSRWNIHTDEFLRIWNQLFFCLESSGIHTYVAVRLCCCSTTLFLILTPLFPAFNSPAGIVITFKLCNGLKQMKKQFSDFWDMIDFVLKFWRKKLCYWGSTSLNLTFRVELRPSHPQRELRPQALDTFGLNPLANWLSNITG